MASIYNMVNRLRLTMDQKQSQDMGVLESATKAGAEKVIWSSSAAMRLL
jgi:hypothetical protein